MKNISKYWLCGLFWGILISAASFFLATMKNLPPVGANLTENDPRTPIFLFHFWNPDNFSILYVKFEENLMDFKNGPNTVNVFNQL